MPDQKYFRRRNDIRPYCALVEETKLTIDLKSGLSVPCTVAWLREVAAGLDPQPALVRWNEGGQLGATFNRLLPLADLVAWLHAMREQLHAA